MFTLTASIQHYTGGASQRNKARKRTGKEDIKLSLYADNMNADANMNVYVEVVVYILQLVNSANCRI